MMLHSPSARPLQTSKQGVAEPNIFGRLSRLPALRTATMQLLSVSLESDSAAADFEKAFRSDPALAADLILVANSAAFGARARIQTIGHAIAMLGLEKVRSLALTISMNRYIGSGRSSEALRAPWRHSVAVAVIAETLGAADKVQAPLLYTAGLMHDIGRLALFQLSPAKYQQVLAAEFSGTQEYLNLERLLFECSHDDAGAFLAMAWGFPNSLCDCIRFHHWDIATHAGQLFELVSIACRLADTLGYPEVLQVHREDDSKALLDLLPARLRNMTGLNGEALRERVETHLAAFAQGDPPAAN